MLSQMLHNDMSISPFKNALKIPKGASSFFTGFDFAIFGHVIKCSMMDDIYI